MFLVSRYKSLHSDRSSIENESSNATLFLLFGMMPDVAAAKTALEIVEALGHQRMVAYMDAASATLVAYEVTLNLHIEIKHIWMGKWTLLTVVYILQRYLPLFDTMGLILHNHVGANLSTAYCALNYKIAGWSFIIGLVLSEILLSVRVWAVWGRSIPGLVVLFLACWVSGYRLLWQFLNSMEFVTLPFPNFRGCFMYNVSPSLFVNWILLMAYDTGTFVLILIPGVKAYRRGGRSELLKTIYQDGVIYYAFIFLTSMINVVVILTLPHDFILLLTSFERVLHSLLTSRAILHIRQLALQHSTFQTVSQLQFASIHHEDHRSPSSLYPGLQRSRPIETPTVLNSTVVD